MNTGYTLFPGNWEYITSDRINLNVYIIGDLPPREDDLKTPQLNKWYSEFQSRRTIPCARTDTAAEKVAKIRTAQKEGKIVIACGNDMAIDGPMLDAADYGVMISELHTSYPGYLTVTPMEMVEVVLWLRATSYKVD